MLRLALALGITDEIFGGAVGPLNFAQGELTRVTLNELVTVSAGSTVDLLNISPGSPGYVQFIHFDIETVTQQTTQNSTIQVYIDGEATPSITTDLVGLCGTAAAANGQWSTENISFASDLSGGVYGLTYNFKFPIPFKSSCHITFTCYSAGACNLWSDVAYRTGINVGYKLWNNCQTFLTASGASISPGTILTDAAMTSGSTTLTSASSSFTSGIVGQRFCVVGASNNNSGVLYTTVATFVNSTTITLALPNSSGGNITGKTAVWGTNPQGNGTTQFLNLGAGNSGYVVFLSITGVSTPGSNDTYLENNLVAYLDGATPLANGVGPGTNPQIDVNGTEDFFTAGFYWLATSVSPWASLPWMMLTNKATGVVTAGMDILDAYGGWQFNNGILIRWETGQRAQPGLPQTAVFLAWNVFYYQPY